MRVHMMRALLLHFLVSLLALTWVGRCSAQQPAPASAPDAANEQDRRLAEAFGAGSAEINQPIRLWIAEKKLAMAMASFETQQGNRVAVRNLAIAFFDDAKDGGTIRAFSMPGVTVLELDRPASAVIDLAKCKILAIQAVQAQPSTSTAKDTTEKIAAPTVLASPPPPPGVTPVPVVVNEPGRLVVQGLPVPAVAEVRFKFKIDPKSPVADLLPKPLPVRRLPDWTNENLAMVPELAIGEPVARTLTKEKAMEATAHILAKINHLNQQKTDGFMLALLERRADLRGLPVRMGEECRTHEEQAKIFALVADAVHQAMQSAKGKDNVPLEDAEKFWKVLTEINVLGIVGGDGSAKVRINRANIECLHRAIVAALMQILMPESEVFRTGLAKYLASVPHADATRALAKLAIFSPEDEVRAAAIDGLKLRRERDYTDVLMQGFRYPLPAVAKRSAEALVKLERSDLAANLIDVLERPDPRLPVTEKHGGKDATVVRELVRVNHHRNCVLCHAPGNPETTPEGVLTVAVPLPNEPLVKPAQGGYQSTPPASPDIVVRIDTTYLRQDFSVMMPVADAHPWPEMQRFDFLVRTRTLTPAEAEAYEPCCATEEPGRLSPYHRAALFALRELTGRDTEPTAAAWRKLLHLPARP